ncbi:antitoxin [Rothia halotolerans]|uniref:antitoxin n=1 Tax=Rothia halotolerans TaxID=405770 RepID=UPI00101BBEDF|nr:antitoxin [Rothia halotolerans]
MGLLDKAKDAADNGKGEEISDSGIDKAKNSASEKTGEKFDDQIDKGAEAADKHVGNE